MKTGPIIGITAGVIAGTVLLGGGAFAAGVAMADPGAQQRIEQRIEQRTEHRTEHRMERIHGSESSPRHTEPRRGNRGEGNQGGGHQGGLKELGNHGSKECDGDPHSTDNTDARGGQGPMGRGTGGA